MSKGPHIPAGGPHSKNVVHRSQVLGERARKHIVAGVSQTGLAQGNHFTAHGKAHDSDYHGVAARGSPFHVAGDGVKLGNEIAETTKCAPGGSRTIYKGGSQSR
jgi:hypothetical protein